MTFRQAQGHPEHSEKGRRVTPPRKGEATLVTGGAGFIGSHLCDALIGRGYKVICVDNFITGSRENIAHLLDNENFKLIEHDIIVPFSSLIPAPSSLNCIFHLASPASPVDYSAFSIETLIVNSLGTYNVLEVAREWGAKVLLASTSEVYGDPKVSPQSEDYWGNVNPVGPRACYDEAKRFAEALTVAYHRRYGLDVVIVRIFNTFGPRMRGKDGRVVPNFIQQALSNKPLTVYGDGSQTRSLCYIDDLIDGLLKAMFSKETTGEIINLGNPNEMTILSLAGHIREMCKSSSEMVFSLLPEDDPLQRRPDISRAEGLLGWKPKISLDEGLTRTIEWFLKGKA
ncbi:MAG: SDR family oxidoreductase [Actinomycetota bacterium]|nr:SDR family oxidoreductase [Actinomycetota bacterium]